MQIIGLDTVIWMKCGEGVLARMEAQHRGRFEPRVILTEVYSI